MIPAAPPSAAAESRVPPGRRGRLRTGGIVATLALAALLAVATWLARGRSVPTVSGALPQAAYLWQRQWTEGVRAAVSGVDAGSPFGALCVAYAEIEPAAGKPPTVRRTSGIDWALLARSHQPVGFAVRVRAFPGEVSAAREPFPTLRAVLSELCADARAAGMRPAEIQVDFDCPTSRLRGFAAWLRALQAAFPGQHLSFTALPAWLRSDDFAMLAAVTGDYVLQVHWFEKPGPAGRPPTTLCDPAAARVAVGQAARLGVPFRVALPTYGYRLVLDAQSRLLAGAGEGVTLEAARPPAGGTVRTLMADPDALAELVRGWQSRRPAALRSVIWYRLPVEGDRLNWTARTLRAVAAGRTPRPKLGVRFTPAADSGPWELRLWNAAAPDAPLPAAIPLHCASVPVAAAAVGGFALQPGETSLQELVFAARIHDGEAARTLPAGTSLGFGWVLLPDHVPMTTAPLLTASLNP